MNSQELLIKINEIAAEGSTTKKREMLLAIIGDPLVKRVLNLTYNSFITFGMTPPKAKVFGTNNFDMSNLDLWTTLIDMADRGLSGDAAKAALLHLYSLANEDSAELLWRILSKDLRCGITAKTVNDVLPGTIPVFDCMLAHKFDETKVAKWPVAVEPKFDGVRVICLVKDGSAKFFSRTGKPFPAVEHLGPGAVAMVNKLVEWAVGRASSADPKGAWLLNYLGNDNRTIALDGEIVSGNFNKTVGDVRRKEESADDAQYHIFDALPYDLFTDTAVKLIEVPYSNRRAVAALLVSMADKEGPFFLAPQELANDGDHVQTLYAKYRAQGLEGAIVKPFEGHYHKRRNRAWTKIKNEETEDLIIIGAFEGEGKYVGKLGGLIVDRAGVKVRIGGGFTDVQRDEFWQVYHADKADTHALGKPFEIIGRMIEIEFHEVTPDGSLRHPRFIRFRDDKHLPAHGAFA